MDKILKIQQDIDQLYKIERATLLAINLSELNNKSEEEKSRIQYAYKKIITLLDIKREELTQAVIDYGNSV